MKKFTESSEAYKTDYALYEKVLCSRFAIRE
jgi:hypothetical protein